MLQKELWISLICIWELVKPHQVFKWEKEGKQKKSQKLVKEELKTWMTTKKKQKLILAAGI